MNSARLREIVDFLLALESEFGTQNKLNEANNQLANIIQQPQQVSFQNQFSGSIRQLHEIAARLQQRLQPAQIALIEEIGGKQYFVDDLASLIDEWVRENAVTPAVAQNRISELVSQRQSYLERITQLRESVESSWD